jgi:Rod binding domain-containing protein
LGKQTKGLVMQITPLASPQSENTPASSASTSRAREVAQQFEAIFVSFMLKAMRGTVGENELMPAGMGEKIYTDMLDGEYAKMMAEHASFGLGDLLMRELESSGATPDAFGDFQQLSMESMLTSHGIHPLQQQLKTESGSLSDSVKQWQSIIDEASSRYDVDSSLVAAMIAQESAGNPHAVSRAGAKGLMQLMDGTARDMGARNVFDPRDNVLSGTRYMRHLLDRFDGNVQLALAGYNAGPSAVERHKGIPPYSETQNYVQRVLGLQKQFLPRNAAPQGENQ